MTGYNKELRWHSLDYRSARHSDEYALPADSVPRNAAQILDIGSGDYARFLRMCGALDGRMDELVSGIKSAHSALGSDINTISNTIGGLERTTGEMAEEIERLKRSLAFLREAHLMKSAMNTAQEREEHDSVALRPKSGLPWHWVVTGSISIFFLGTLVASFLAK